VDDEAIVLIMSTLMKIDGKLDEIVFWLRDDEEEDETDG
jgi:hypothetical protein